jgi:hypothetical protein
MKNYNKYFLIILFIIGTAIYLIKFSDFIAISTPPIICNNESTPSVNLLIPPIAQESNFWCWAASLEMVIDYYKPALNVSQCQIATKHLELFPPGRWTPTIDEACTCSTTINGTCKTFNRKDVNNAHCQSFNAGLKNSEMVNRVMTLLDNYNLVGISITNRTPNTLSNIKAHLRAGHPIIGFYLNPSFVNHIVVIKGFTDIDLTGTLMLSSSYLFINNPLNNTYANCEYCYHWISTGCFGQNMYPNTRTAAGRTFDLGTYTSKYYLAICPKPVTP